MKDGYYLSVYIHIDPVSHMHEFLRVRHDQNLSLWKKTRNTVELIHYWELERLTGFKMHNRSFFSIMQAKDIINQLLMEYNLTLDDMEEIWGTPQLQTCNDYHSLGVYPNLSYHSVAHLFSAVLSDTEKFYNEKIIGLALDAGPDRVIDGNIRKQFYYSGCYVDKGKYHMFPVYSPGLIWRYTRKRYGLREGTLMALASASTSVAYIGEGELAMLLPDKSDSLPAVNKYVDALIAKVHGFTAEDAGKLFNGFDPRFSEKDNKISMVMKEIQKLSLKIVDRTLDEIIERFGVDTRDTYLAMSGGYALNCPTNSYLMEKYGFKGFMAPPCVSDTGLSLGIALYAFCSKLNRFHYKLTHSFQGNADDNLEKILNQGNYKLFIKNVSQMDLKRAVADLQEAPVVWFLGKSEIGPRALGHRSLIASPCSNLIKDRLNEIKQRQWWRPVAPIILEEEVNNWFENAYPTPFMLHTFQIRKEKKHLVPAILHLDDSARVQTIKVEENPMLYYLIKAFSIETGIPIICNTSLNDCGEPIIDRIEEALNFALRKGIKIIYVNGKRLELQNHCLYPHRKPHARKIDFLVYKTENEHHTLKKNYNPHNIPDEVLKLYYYRPELCEKFNIKTEEDARKFQIYAKFALNKLSAAAVLDV